jgi:putative DNA primase/helicase
MEELAARFDALFRGSERSHGYYLPDAAQYAAQTGKQKGSSLTKPGPAELSDWEAHLDGTAGVGICPLLIDGTCTWGAVDIDRYGDVDHGAVAVALLGHHIPAVVARSRSGGVHVLLFAKEAVPAGVMQGKLREVAALLGHGASEIFPKQSTPTESGGNWLNAPYFDGDRTKRYAVNPDGDALTAEEFLDLAQRSKAAPEWFRAPLAAAGAPKSKSTKGKRRAFILPDQIPDGQRDITLTAYAGSLRRLNIDRDGILSALRIENQKRCVPPMSDSDLERIAESIGRKEPGAELEEGVIQRMAGAITASAAFARDAGGLLYHFEGGVYKPTGRRFIEKQVKHLCEQQAPKSWTPELATRIESWIAVDAPELLEQPPLDVLNVRNGLLDVRTRTLSPHTPDHLSVVQIAANFDPQATCLEIDKFVGDVFPSDAFHLSAEVTGWLMTPDNSIQKAILLLGDGSNGKSVWLNMLITFLGKENVSTLSLHRIESDKFSAARLVGKLANIGMDLPTAALAGTSAFKNITGGDVISAERKFESSFEFRPFVRLLFSANSAPRSDDATHGFFRRWLVIPFFKTFDESDPHTVPRAVLDARLAQPGELSGLLNRALDALPAIRKGRFTESASTRAALADFRATTDPLAVWLDQNTTERADGMVLKDLIRRAYGQVCQDSGRPILGDVQFTGALKRLRPKVEAARRTVDGRKTQVYLGLGMMTAEDHPSGLF